LLLLAVSERSIRSTFPIQIFLRSRIGSWSSWKTRDFAERNLLPCPGE
jgi:hypothetical protein